MATAPVFAVTPNTQVSQVSAANSNRDGTGTLVTIFTAGSSGSIIEKIIVRSTVTTTAGMVRFYYDDGTNTRLVEELVVAAITVGAAIEAFEGTVANLEELVVETGHTIKASIENAEATNILVHGSDF